jgi:myo-inositol-1(or 4)-monophosphatase
VRQAVLPLAGTAAGRAQLEVGAGGDRTMELDRAAEAVVFTELQAAADRGERFSVLSEEAGYRGFGAGYPLVLVDPVDGSRNAKGGIPLFGVMLAVLDGPTIADTIAGYVLNLNTGETWTAIRKHGAWRAGEPLTAQPSQVGARFQLIGLESTPRGLAMLGPLLERTSKIRILGSMALAIAHTASGAFEVFCAPIPIRVFDTAASLLLLEEAGGVATDIDGRPIGHLACTLDVRTTLLCAPSKELHDEALNTLRSQR